MVMTQYNMVITQYNMVITQYNMVITIGILIITQYQHTYVYIYVCIVTGWWFGTFGLFFHILGYIGNKNPN